MSKERQILQLREKGYSQRRIADTLKVSRNTVAKFFDALQRNPVSDDFISPFTDQELHLHLFPEETQVPILLVPDYDFIHKELMKSEVTLKLVDDKMYLTVSDK